MQSEGNHQICTDFNSICASVWAKCCHCVSYCWLRLLAHADQHHLECHIFSNCTPVLRTSKCWIQCSISIQYNTSIQYLLYWILLYWIQHFRIHEYRITKCMNTKSQIKLFKNFLNQSHYSIEKAIHLTVLSDQKAFWIPEFCYWDIYYNYIQLLFHLKQTT